MEDGYFYTLSAIAQSFAAIIALNGIFVIFRLQILRTQRSELIQQLKTLLYKYMGGDSGHAQDRKRARETSESFSEKDLLKWTKQATGEAFIVEEKQAIATKLRCIEELYDNVLSQVKLPLILNGCVITYSILFLIIKSLWRGMPSWIVLCIGGLFSIYALYRTVDSIIVTVFKQTD